MIAISSSSTSVIMLFQRKKKEALRYRSASLLNQRLPILPGGLPPSTFGVCGLNCCVRHGNRWIPAAIATEFMFQDSYPDNCIKLFVLTPFILNTFLKCCHTLLNAAVWSSSTSVFKTSVTRFPHPLRSSLRSKRFSQFYASLSLL